MTDNPLSVGPARNSAAVPRCGTGAAPQAINTGRSPASAQSPDTTALSAIEGQRKSREALAVQRRREASTLADLKAEHVALGGKGRQIETEAAPTPMPSGQYDG